MDPRETATTTTTTADMEGVRPVGTGETKAGMRNVKVVENSGWLTLEI